LKAGGVPDEIRRSGDGAGLGAAWGRPIMGHEGRAQTSPLQHDMAKLGSTKTWGVLLSLACCTGALLCYAFVRIEGVALWRAVGYCSAAVGLTVIAARYLVQRSVLSPLDSLWQALHEAGLPRRNGANGGPRVLTLDCIPDLADTVRRLVRTLRDTEHRFRDSVVRIGSTPRGESGSRQVVDFVLESAIEITGAESGSVMLLSPEDNLLRIKSARGLAPEVVRDAAVPLGVGLAGRTAQRQEAQMVQGPAPDSHTPDRVRSALCVPLTVKGRVLGVLNLGNKRSGAPFDTADLEIAKAMAVQAAVAIDNAALYDQLHVAFMTTIQVLADAVEAKDLYTRGHSERVTEYSLDIAAALHDRAIDVGNLEFAAILHDIGKIGVPEAVLNKPGPLTDEEFALVRQHSEIGARIVRSVDLLHPAIPIILHHHERFDGTGYPHGLSGVDIPLEARIVAVADAWDAMRSDRPYRGAMSRDDAALILATERGKQFDPRIVDAFLASSRLDGVRVMADRGDIPQAA
jgi:HD-GYP domain-containing protein (c-di-GMP phosphodiesterase class II)